MNQFLDSILRKEVQTFIEEHESSDVQQLLLKHKTVHGIPTAWVAQQIVGRKHSKLKLPTWYGTKGIVFPPSLNLEQCSSESTANFKSALLDGETSAADLTGGFGVDTYAISRVCPVVYVEPQLDLLEIAKHNHQVLGVSNITYHHGTAEEFLKSNRNKFGLIYLDPSRRKSSQKVYKLEECQPDVTGLQPELFSHASCILLKTSPLFDIMQGLRELPQVSEVIAVAIENECKELLFLQDEYYSGEPSIRAIDIYPKSGKTHDIRFSVREERNATPEFSSPLKYLYEPNVAILKAGAFKWIATQYKLFKLAPNTHLYTSNEKVDFPGRTFEVRDHVAPGKKLKDQFPGGFANIIARNYPLTVEEIKKKTGLKEGGDLYLICAQTEKEKIAMMAERIK